ncbi:hypothetical protein GCM10027195_22740 [Comamonas sediminis]
MGIQGQVDLFFDGFGQAVTANQNHGVKVVGFGAVLATLGGSKLYLGHSPYYRGSREKT